MSSRASVAAIVLAAAWTFGAAGRARAAVAPAFAGKVTLSTYVAGAASATDIAFAADGRAVVTTKAGPIYVRHADGSLVAVASPFPGTLDVASEKGLLGVVADPNVAQSRAFYFYVSDGPDGDKHRVYRAVLGATNDQLTADAAPIVGASRGLGPGLEGPANHDGGGLSIAGGKLYVSVGDTGSNATPPVNKYGSCLNKGNGKILRVNLDGTIPGDNPLVGLSSATGCDSPTGPWTTAAPDRRVFVWGQRNPFRLWVDPSTGLAWVGDVGELDAEEIAIYAGDQHGGYPFVEGSVAWGAVGGNTCTTLTPSRACTAPAYAYDHAVGRSVTGGRIVDGCGWNKALGGASYVFGDWSSGWIRVLRVNAARTGLASTTPVDLASGSGPVAFRMGPDQALYVVFNGDGTVQRLAPADASGADCAAAVPAGSPASTATLAGLLALAGAASLAFAGAARGAARRRRAPRGAGPHFRALLFPSLRLPMDGRKSSSGFPLLSPVPLAPRRRQLDRAPLDRRSLSRILFEGLGDAHRRLE